MIRDHSPVTPTFSNRLDGPSRMNYVGSVSGPYRRPPSRFRTLAQALAQHGQAFALGFLLGLFVAGCVTAAMLT